MKKLIPSIILTGAMSSGSLFAIDVYEGYDYGIGDLSVNASGSTGGTGWTGGWYGNAGLTFADNSGSDIIDGSVATGKTWTTPTGYGFTPTGNVGRNDSSNGNVAYRQLSGSNTIDFGADGDYYFSFLVNKPTGGGAFNFGIGASDAGTGDATTWAGIQLGGGSGDAVQAGTFGAQFPSGDPGKGYNFSPGALTEDADLLVVGRLRTFANTGQNDTIAFNIYGSGDTVVASDPGTFSFAFGATAQSGVADRITFGVSATGNDSTGGGGNSSVVFDEFRMGDTWESVVVPEPSAYGLIAGALALGWVMVRRRK